MPAISIIIPAYNKGSFIFETLESCINQTYSDCEIIIVDDCSKDETINEIQKFLKIYRQTPITLLCNEENMGVSFSRNIGIQKAIGEYVLFLDADDILHPDAIYILYQTAQKNNADIVFSQREYFSGNNQFKNDIVQSCDLQVQVLSSPPQTSVGVLFRKSIIDQHKILFEPELRNGEDTLFTALFFCLSRNMYRICYPLYMYRRDDMHSLSRGQWNNPKIEIPREINMLRYMEKYFRSDFFVQSNEKAKAIRIIRNKKNAVKYLLCQIGEKKVPSELKFKLSLMDILFSDMNLTQKLIELIYICPLMESLFCFRIFFKIKHITHFMAGR